MSTTTEPARESDEAILHRMGYAQVLYREMGGFSNFAISFTIISILAGCLTSYYIAWNSGGPPAITWGWLLVGVFCVLVAMAMGEIASAMPTAGALYFWASKLGGPAWGWFTGWFNLIGQIAVTAAIDYGAATFTTALLNLWLPDVIGADLGSYFITFTVIMALHLALNLLGVNVLGLLNSISAWWHMAGVAVIVLILWIVPEHHQSAAFVFGQMVNTTGFNQYWFVFGLGLLMSQYTVTGYDASAHMSEETRSASRTAAVGMVMAVVVSVVFGFILLVAVTFAVPSANGAPDVDGVSAAGSNAVTFIWTSALGNGLAEFLLLIAVIAQFFCGTASVTAASRMLFAFSRDGAVPFSKTWRKVNANRVPVNAVIIIAVLSWILMIPTLLNGAIGYQVGTSIAVIGLYIAFALPIILRIRAGEAFEHGAWSLGKHYKWIAPLAVGWIGIVCILFLLPTSTKGVWWGAEFDWQLLNYAPITVGAALIGFGGWFLLSAKNWFTGPVREAGSEEELAEIEHQLDAGHGTVVSAASATAAGAATAGAAGAATALLTKDADATVDAPAEEADPVAEDAVAEDAVADETVADETVADETVADETVADETVAETVSAEDVSTEHAVAEIPAAETPSDGTVAEDVTTEDVVAEAPVVPDVTPEDVPAEEAPAEASEGASAEVTPDPATEEAAAEPEALAEIGEPAEETAEETAEVPAAEEAVTAAAATDDTATGEAATDEAPATAESSKGEGKTTS